jgi:hypothetical protein
VKSRSDLDRPFLLWSFSYGHNGGKGQNKCFNAREGLDARTYARTDGFAFIGMGGVVKVFLAFNIHSV